MIPNFPGKGAVRLGLRILLTLILTPFFTALATDKLSGNELIRFLLALPVVNAFVLLAVGGLLALIVSIIATMWI